MTSWIGREKVSIDLIGLRFNVNKIMSTSTGSARPGRKRKSTVLQRREHGFGSYREERKKCGNPLIRPNEQ